MIITISRGSYSKGKEVAELVAQKLNYECISREIILEASEEFHIPEIKLIRALHDAPSIFDRFDNGKEKFITYIQAELLEHFQKNNVVYHGLAGQFFVRGVSHVLKVRIIADLESRAALEMKREQISRERALSIIKHDDEERRKWSKQLYGIDTYDASLYDLIIHIHKITVKDAAKIIVHTAGLEHFQPTPESQKIIKNLALAAKVKAALIGTIPDVTVSAENGYVDIRVLIHARVEKPTRDKVKTVIENISEARAYKLKIKRVVQHGL